MSMENTNEDIVTKILSNHEILLRDYAKELFENKSYKTNPKYDLSHYLSTTEPSKNRFDDKYLFVK